MTEQEANQIVGSLVRERANRRKQLCEINCKLTRAQGLAREFADKIDEWKDAQNRLANTDNLSELSRLVDGIQTTFEERPKLISRLKKLDRELSTYDG